MLSGAIDAAAPDPRDITDILSAIPGFWEGVRLAEQQIEAGEFVALEDFVASFDEPE